MPVFVNTFNHSHEFVQLSLALNPAMFTNKVFGIFQMNIDLVICQTNQLCGAEVSRAEEDSLDENFGIGNG
jgi:hypothetical protein